jgi:outer membrane protein OmpA-like peptidoglycan-associated protein
MESRRWDGCAVAGGLIGAAVGGGTAGGLVNAYEKERSDAHTGAAAGGGAIVGAALGTLIGHAICDPVEAPPPPPVAQAAPPPPPPPPPAKGTKIATIGGAQFDFNRAEIKPAGRDILDGAVKTLRDNPRLNVVVEGHTDSVGNDAYNQKLSERRAKAVRDYLVRQGIDGSRITARGYGKSKPVATNATEEGRAQNRRADIVAD